MNELAVEISSFTFTNNVGTEITLVFRTGGRLHQTRRLGRFARLSRPCCRAQD